MEWSGVEWIYLHNLCRIAPSQFGICSLPFKFLNNNTLLLASAFSQINCYNKRQERNSIERKPDVILQYNNQKLCKRLTSFDFVFDLFQWRVTENQRNQDAQLEKKQ